MKIGIVTFHRAHNYGAVLQCFALQETLKASKHDVEIIDYSCRAIENVYSNGLPKIKRNSLKNAIKSIIISLLKGHREYIRYKRFDDFIKNYLNLSTHISSNSTKELNLYDGIVFGSDQIWNGSLTQNDTFYFGDFNYKGLKISYGASAGKREKDISSYYKLLSSFDALGVREESLNKIFKNIGLYNCYTNIDPTLLLTATQWVNLLGLRLNKPSSNKYVLAYPLRERAETLKLANSLAKEFNYKLYEIGARVMIRHHRNRLEKIGPVDFLNEIYNSEIIITNSFHGTVFSLIFNKNFYTVTLGDGEDGRVINLLSKLNLEDRIIRIGEKISYMPIDYNSVNATLSKLRKESLYFLNSIF